MFADTRFYLIPLFLLSAQVAGASGDAVLSVRKTVSGADIRLSTGTLRLEGYGEAIRVRFSPTGHFYGLRVPTLLPQANRETIAFRVSSSAKTISFSRGDMVAKVDRRTGAVRFEDRAGRLILAETPGSRSMPAVTLPGPEPVKSHEAALRFSLQPHEAIFGLGQHQQGLLDYRGSDLFLEQQNREVAIPFAVSSKGYGLLWNNASGTKVDMGGAEQPIPSSYLFDDAGRKGGLSGHYFTGRNFETPIFTRTDADLNFDWSKTPPPGMPHDDYSVRWTGSFVVPQTGDYTLNVASDDGSRLWIDDKQVLSDWSVHPVENVPARIHLDSGRRHKIRLEFFQAGGESVLHVFWSRPTSSSSIGWKSEATDQLDYLVFNGPSIDEVIRKYRDVTGNVPLIPKWALGYWQSKERYSTQQEWIDIATEYRQRKDPIDNLVQDWFYWDPYPWGSDEFDPKRYPDPAAGITQLHDRFHLHFMISVLGKFNPGRASYPNRNYGPMNSLGTLYPSTVSSPDRYYDAFDPAAGKLYWNQMRNELFDKGVDAWWLDASEPEVNMHALRLTHTHAGLGALVLNAWPLMHTHNVFAGQMASAPNKRPFILTRSAYVGQQRNGAATWSGDITATWQVFASQIPAGLNFCLSGIPYWTTDIGAFFENYPGGHDNPEYRELYTRWFQYGAFCPIFRSHGTSTSKEMWRFGPKTESILRKYDVLRYRLMPYIYSQAWKVSSNGETLMRALVIDFPKDLKAIECKDEFLFGPSVLVCPVIKQNATSREVYLPKGADWYDYWTGQRYRGGRTITAAAPIETMPLFVKAGSIIPLGPEIQYVDEKGADPIELHVYPGKSGSFELYEDQGANNEYLKGRRSAIQFQWDDANRTLTIGKRRGWFAGMLHKRTFKILVGSGAPKSVLYSGARVVVDCAKS